MTTILEKSVKKSGDGTYAFACPGITASPCGAGPDGPPFTSTGWPTRKSAVARGAQHFAEHRGEGAAQSLEEFRADQGLSVTPEGTVKVEAL